LVAGGVLLVWSAVAAIVIHLYPAENALDRWGFNIVTYSRQSSVLGHITDVGTPAILAAGCVLAALVVIRQDQRRAVACVLGPLAATLAVEIILKPLIGRRYQEVLSYPSGNVTVIASMATAWVVAVPRRLRPAVVVIAVVAVALMIYGVVGLRWHYPSDALAGAAFGVGMVLAVDGLLHLGWPDQLWVGPRP
jgi:membrane-associated phospholipid phosphatase